MLQISAGCIQELVRPKTWDPDHIKFWELQSWGPNVCPNQGQPSGCPTGLPFPHLAPVTSSPQKLNVFSVPTGFTKTLLCPPAAGREGPCCPRLPTLTEAHRTEAAYTAPSLPVYTMTASMAFLSLFYDIQHHASLTDDHNDNWLWAPTQLWHFWKVLKPLLFPTFPRGFSGGYGASCNSQKLTPPRALTLSVLPGTPKLSSFAPTKWENSFLKWS